MSEQTTEVDNEQFYDDHVAPVLADLAKKCTDRGMHLCAFVEFDAGEFGTTCGVASTPSFSFLLAEAAMRCRGNVDSLFAALAKHAREHGHSSLILSQMGVPPVPGAPAGRAH